MPVAARSGAAWNQYLGNLSGSPVWLAGAQALELSFCFPKHISRELSEK